MFKTPEGKTQKQFFKSNRPKAGGGEAACCTDLTINSDIQALGSLNFCLPNIIHFENQISCFTRR